MGDMADLIIEQGLLGDGPEETPVERRRREEQARKYIESIRREQLTRKQTKLVRRASGLLGGE